MNSLVKKRLLSCWGCLIILISACHRPEQTEVGFAQFDRSLLQLLNQKEYFKLEARLLSAGANIGEAQQLYFRAYLSNAFNRNAEAVGNIDAFLKNDAAGLPDSVKAALYQLQSDSYFKLFQYADAARNDSLLLNRYAAILDSGQVSDIKNFLLIRNALRAVPPQQTIIKDSATIHYKKNKIGLIELPLTCRDVLYDGIFDTRANISSITQTYARRLGLKMLPVTYEESSGITGIKFSSGLGVADSLYIGPILVRHAVFQVMPDSVLYIAPLKLSLDIIIGFPIIAQLREIQLYKDGRIFIPLVPSRGDLHNFALDGLDPVVSLPSDQDTLCFHLDLGADQTILYSGYFEKYKSRILQNGIKKSSRFGGAGGIQEEQVYEIPALHLSLGGHKITLDSLDILTRKIFPDERFYGNLGRDFAGKFDVLVFNFQYMYLQGR